MKRREVLTGLTGPAAAALAGCVRQATPTRAQRSPAAGPIGEAATETVVALVASVIREG